MHWAAGLTVYEFTKAQSLVRLWINALFIDSFIHLVFGYCLILLCAYATTNLVQEYI